MGLIKNAVDQGKQAVEHIAKLIPKSHNADFDVLVIGAGPAGISATLTAKKHKLKAICLEQDTLGGTVFTFPRSKIVMTSPMTSIILISDLPAKEVDDTAEGYGILGHINRSIPFKDLVDLIEQFEKISQSIHLPKT